MDARTRLFLWSLAGCGFFAVLGALFGALAAVLNRREGRAAGSAVGLTVAAAFERLGDHLPPLTRAAVVGGVDGLTFGAVVGALLGLGLAWEGQDEWPRLRSAFASGLGLVAVATVFGLMGHGLSPKERYAVVGLCGGGLGGVAVGFLAGGTDGLILGALLGLVIGAAVSWWAAGRGP